MRVLVTSSRMPFALGMVRQLADAGHEVYAADDYERSPGSHSKYLSRALRLPVGPRDDTEEFIADARADRRRARDRRDRAGVRGGLLPLDPARAPRARGDDLRRPVRVARAPARQGRLRAACAAPRPADPRDGGRHLRRASCAQAIGRFDRYFARAVFSRGGVALLTNTGPLAGLLDRRRAIRRRRQPWLVQPFVEGETVCTYTTVHDGRSARTCMYRIPRQWHHSTGIQFESVDGLESLRLIEPIVAELGYTGQISFDFLVTDDGLSFVECNPRATDGLLLLELRAARARAARAGRRHLPVAAGETTQLDLALVGDAFSDKLERVPETIRDLARFKDAGDGWHDPLPTRLLGPLAGPLRGRQPQEPRGAPGRDGRRHELGRRRRSRGCRTPTRSCSTGSETADREQRDGDPRPVREHVDRVRVAALDVALVDLVADRVRGRRSPPRPRARGARAPGPGPRPRARRAGRTR